MPAERDSEARAGAAVREAVRRGGVGQVPARVVAHLARLRVRVRLRLRLRLRLRVVRVVMVRVRARVRARVRSWGLRVKREAEG